MEFLPGSMDSLHPHGNAAGLVRAGVRGERPVGVPGRCRADAHVAGHARVVEVVERKNRLLRREVVYLQAAVAELRRIGGLQYGDNVCMIFIDGGVGYVSTWNVNY